MVAVDRLPNGFITGDRARNRGAQFRAAAIEPLSIEARIVQDADRLDALGAVGLSRLFVVAGALGRPLYSVDDPFCSVRAPDDSRFTIDHIYRKLFVIASTLRSRAGREEGARRCAVIETFLNQLAREIGV